ncbi:hypothetical protein BDP67DRAFT_167717 [Colletotrichum lupini]|nr:hypothetical protein BDP67DRAFT_167717 [Colletotrichum lupini]
MTGTRPGLIRWSPSELVSRTKQIISSIDTDLENWFGVSSGGPQPRAKSNFSDSEEDEDGWVNISVSSKARDKFGKSQMGEESRLTTASIADDTRRQRHNRRLPLATKHRRLKRSHHVERCLIDVSEKLYRALLKQSACCTRESRNHTGRICLDGFPLHEDGNNLPNSRHLSLFLSYQWENKPSGWHGAECLLQSEESASHFLTDKSDLCSILRSCAIYREGLNMTLYQLSDNTPAVRGTRNEDRRTTVPEIALGRLIDRKIFVRSYKSQIYPVNRATICLNLSLALMHLSSEAWLGGSWSVDNIYFLHDPDTSPNYIQQLDHPYVSRAIIENKVRSRNHETQTDLDCEKACVLSFLRVVMEIMGGKRVELKDHANDLDLLYELRRTKDEICQWYPEILEDVIVSCLAFCRSPERDPDPILHRIWIWTNIVQPFEDLANSFKRIPHQKVE